MLCAVENVNCALRGRSYDVVLTSGTLVRQCNPRLCLEVKIPDSEATLEDVMRMQHHYYYASVRTISVGRSSTFMRLAAGITALHPR